MPVWHEATRALREDDRLVMVGIVQEQHPNRAQLFMQWKQMDWPIMVDALNELGVHVVPITIFIDDHGIIRSLRPPRGDIASAAEAFAGTTYDPPPGDTVSSTTVPSLQRLREAASEGTVDAARAYGVALVNWGGQEHLDEAISVLGESLQGEADGPTHFKLGVTYRKRMDSPYRRPGDFQEAVNHWGRALSIDPNQYIWRRRIQQYGPRLQKPYSFFDWVVTARADIEARGETPHALPVEPSGAEFARPARAFNEGPPTLTEPDPDDRIQHDRRGFITTEATVVPATVKAGFPVRVHLVFRPNGMIKSHWNNEAQAMRLWVSPPDGWAIDLAMHVVPNATDAVSLETRRIELELRVPRDAAAGVVKLPAYALYNVCQDADGVCLYRRQDIVVEIHVAER